jgi:hypothetical protein
LRSSPASNSSKKQLATPEAARRWAMLLGSRSSNVSDAVSEFVADKH